jgi:general stress protein 26
MDDSRNAQELLADLTDGLRTVMHVDTSAGHLQCRPMTVIERSDDGVFRFLADRRHEWVGEGEVLLAFSDDDDGRWVSAHGRQRVITERAEAERLWNPVARAWFDGPDDPDLVVLAVEVDEFAWWDSPASKLVRAATLAKGAITGNADEGDHGVDRV